MSLCCASLLPSLSCVKAAICKYADVVTVASHTHTHSVSKGLCGVNMFGAIMPDHLIMTRPLGSRACLHFPSPYMLITQFSHNALQHYRFISHTQFRWLQRLTEQSAALSVFLFEGHNWCVLSFSVTAFILSATSSKFRRLFGTCSLLVIACRILITTAFHRGQYCLKYHRTLNVSLTEMLVDLQLLSTCAQSAFE